MAVISMTHSNCIDTFNYDRLRIREKMTNDSYLAAITSPIRFSISVQSTSTLTEKINDLLEEFKKFSIIFQVGRVKEKSNEFLRWKVDKNFYVVLSEDLKRFFNLLTPVLTAGDEDVNHLPIIKNAPLKELYIIIGHRTESETVIKEKNKEMNRVDLINVFNARITTGDKLVESEQMVSLQKLSDENTLLILSKELRESIGLKYCGYLNKGTYVFTAYDIQRSFKEKWSISVYDLKTTRMGTEKVVRDVNLSRQQFLSLDSMVKYLNLCHESVIFTLNKENFLKMEIKETDIGIEFDNDLRDILGFQSNKYSGPGVFRAKGELSLTCMIQFLYIYSNISKMIRIGDIKAPILAVVPFNPKPCRVTTERNFKLPMYVPVSYNHINQIDIGIYDDAGKLVPFHINSTTMLRLHFRQTSLS